MAETDGRKQTAEGRAAAVDGLRGLAALSVVLYHCWQYSGPNPNRPVRAHALDYTVFEARIGLVLFFVLSGCLLYRPYARAIAACTPLPDAARYAARRFARIVPAYWAAIAGAVLLVAAAGDTPGARPVELAKLPLFAIFGQNYVGSTIMRLDPVTWTLCVEVAFYAALPLLAVLVHRVARGRRWPEWALLVALVAGGIWWNAALYEGRASLIELKALPAFMPYFALGMAVAAWAARRERPLGARPTGALVALGFALVAANAALHATGVAGAAAVLGTLTDLPAATGFALIVAGAVGGVGRGVTWLGVRPLAAVGVASYGLYLWHVPLLLLARRLDVLHGGFAGAFLVVLPFALATAAASWILIERPAIARAAGTRLLPWPARSSASQA